jgi:hypothetical protein
MQKETDNKDKTLNPAPSSPGSAEVIPNANPRANENIRVRSAEPAAEESSRTGDAGSEITDGEDG